VRDNAETLLKFNKLRFRRPNLSRISPRLDVRVASVAPARTAKSADLWATLRLPNRGRIEIPLQTNNYFEKRGGNLCPIVQLCTEDNTISVRLVSDITDKCKESRENYLGRD